VLVGVPGWARAEEALSILNRDRNIRESVLGEFTRRARIELDYQVAGSAAEITAWMREDPSRFDLVVLPSAVLERMAQEDRLQPLDPSLLANLPNVAGPFADPLFDPGMRFGVPYLWGAWGIGYTELKASRPRRWDDVLLSDVYAGDIHLPAVPEIIRLLVKIMGGSANTTEPDEIENAARLLARLRPKLKSTDPERGLDMLSVGQVAVSIVPSEQIQPRRLGDGTLGFVIPVDGSILTIDSLAIPKAARHVEEAHRFIDFVLEPKIHAQIATALRAGCPNAPAMIHVPQPMRVDRSIYPKRETMARLEPLRWTGYEAERLYEAALAKALAA
jgi:spermidine/putrescine transport system substrate-binding protein